MAHVSTISAGSSVPGAAPRWAVAVCLAGALLLSACAHVARPPVTTTRQGECPVAGATIVGTKVDVEIAKFLDLVEGAGVHATPQLLGQATDWAKNAETIEYVVCRALVQGASAVYANWLRAFLHFRAGSPTAKEQLEWDAQHPQPGVARTGEAPTLRSIAGRYDRTSGTSVVFEFMDAIGKEEIFIVADDTQPGRGTYVRRITWPPIKTWVEDKRTGERVPLVNRTQPEYSEEKGPLAISGSRLTFGPATYSSSASGTDKYQAPYSRTISISADDPRILFINDGRGGIEVWQRRY